MRSASAATVNADNPWPGLLSFREADREFFEGRRSETEDLLRLVLRERLTVLFGLSGLGKSSLLQAGLFPQLRQEGILPVYVRLDFSSPSPDLIGQIKRAITAQASAAEIEAPESRPGERLWDYLHRQDTEFWTRRNRPVVPLLALDQFEEVFTLGRRDAQRVQATNVLLDELADLAEGRPPAALKARLDEHPDEAKQFSFTRHPYKLLLSIREDFLPELEGLRERLPSVALNRLRLQRMNGRAALRVVARAEHLIDQPVAEKVVRFVAAARDGVPLESLEVEPALLSVVCRELNNTRQQRQEAKISDTLLEGSRDEVLNDFYERTVGDLPLEVRRFIEERMITVSGFRDSMAVENALSAGLAVEQIDLLVERRLLRREDRGGVQRIELTHDLLTGVVRASRDRRRNQEAAEKERLAIVAEQERERQRLQEQREQEDRVRAARDLRRTRLVAVVIATLLIATIVGLVVALRQRNVLIRVTREEQDARGREQAARKQEQLARVVAEDASNRIRQSLLIRQAALSGDRAKLDDLLAKLEQNENIRFTATARDLHYKSGGQDIYQFALFPRPETLPSGDDAVAFVTYVADHPTFQNTLMTAGESRQFRATYTGWGCLNPILALTEYVDTRKAPTVTVFNMCKELGGGWYQGP
jgi:hypothetical protein